MCINLGWMSTNWTSIACKLACFQMSALRVAKNWYTGYPGYWVTLVWAECVHNEVAYVFVYGLYFSPRKNSLGVKNIVGVGGSFYVFREQKDKNCRKWRELWSAQDVTKSQCCCFCLSDKLTIKWMYTFTYGKMTKTRLIYYYFTANLGWFYFKLCQFTLGCYVGQVAWTYVLCCFCYVFLLGHLPF